MKKRWAFALLLLAGSARGEAPWIEGEARLAPLRGGRTTLVLDGWAMSSCGRVDLAFSVDGKTLLEGHPFLRWPGIRERFHGLASAEFAGFSTPVDSGSFGPGTHEALLVARGCGAEKVLHRSSFEVRPSTPAWVAGPVLLLLLAALPLALGAGLARLAPMAFERPWVPWALAGVWVLAFVAILAGPHLGPVETPLEPVPFAPLANWDGGWYFQIAHEGYSVSNPRPFVFFPLYPLILRALLHLPVPERLAASLLNGVFFALAMACLRRLYPGGDHALLVYALLPFGFFFSAVYTEALFVFLAAAVFLAVRREKGLAAGVLGGLAALTRVNGVLTGLFALEAFRSRSRWRAVAVGAGTLAGLAAWMLQLQWQTGDPLKFLHAQASFGRSSSFRPALLLDRLLEALQRGSALGLWEVGLLMAVLTGAAGLLWKRRWAEGLFSAAVVLMPLFTHSTTSLNRYALAAFPALVFLGERIPPRALPFVAGGELALMLLYASRFGRQVFVG